ncbi:MAG TPA: phosphoenolpyruvate--protein phosphotransferase, partial [Roseiflexaceae bacterium]|nr:phosphoenolpyruvate--protein phosphotransferase [Roseiflexaceae bacterium]
MTLKAPIVDQKPQAGVTLALKAPLSGFLMPIERVPDPVFAQKMVGDGMAVDPTSQSLLAPCDGEVVMLHPANHALTLMTPEGVEVLMHIGLDTINLKGQGFTPKVKAGDRVKAGDVLIDFDADYLATHAKSLLTMIVVTNTDRVAAFNRRAGSVTAGQDVVLDLKLASGQTATVLEVSPPVTSEAILIPNTAGLHARPAAVLANLAKKYSSDIWLQRGDSRANAKSVVSLMGLDVRYNDKVTLIAQGLDAHLAIDTLVPQIAQGLGEEGTPAPAPASRVVADIAKPAPAPRSEDPNLLLGVTASPGLAVGTAFQVRHQDLTVDETAKDSQAEFARLDEAIETARRQLEALQVQLHGQADANKAAIFAAHQEILDDPELRDTVRSAILKGKSAAYAWQQAINTQASQLAGLHNELLAARAADVRDVGQRVLMNLTGAGPRRFEAPANSILIAEDLTPSDTANLDRSLVLGFVTTLGSATSHAAIIARSLDIPAVAGVEPRALEIPNGTPVILDGSKGTLRLNPSAEEMTRLQARQQQLAAKKQADLEHAAEPATTTDGYPMEIVANIGGLADARTAVSLGGEGVGLLRTEFLFLDRQTAPTEDEQAQVYADIAKALGPDRPLVIRTLDVGGDKPLPYLPMPKEENPFLGERGVRVGLNRPEVLRTQVRAILRAAGEGKLLVMFPMVATLAEWRAAKAIVEEERARLGTAPIPVGIMVEIPAAAIMAEQFAREADFFSIGSNDLTQYTLAMDRGHPKLAPQVDGLNPAVLQL